MSVIRIVFFISIVINLCNGCCFAEFSPEPVSSISTFQRERIGHHYMVVTAHALASNVAEKILDKGGSAVDAAIAAQMVLTVVEPQSSGIGGGGFLLYYDVKHKYVTSFDGREIAPNSVSPDLFLDKYGQAIPFFDAVRSGKSVGVPGLVLMLADAHKKYGKLPWKDLFIDAITIANDGFLISSRLYGSIVYASQYTMSESFKSLYLDNDGNPKSVGSRFKNPELAEVLRDIARGGPASFYSGDIAESIVHAVQLHGGALTIADFAGYDSKEREPVCGYYRHYRVCSMGLPSSGGITVLQTLGILNHFELSQAYNLTEIHIILEAEKRAFSDRNYYLADRDFVRVPSNDQLLNSDYLRRRAEEISLEVASQGSAIHGDFSVSNGADASYDAPSTTHLSIVDREGNAVSLTSSVEHSFGSGIVVNGFVLNNQLTDFSFIPEINGKPVANAVYPEKRPRSSMTPVFIFSPDGTLFSVLGSPGGSSIISYVRKTIIALIDWEMPLQLALNSPHFMHKNTHVIVEPTLEEMLIDNLMDMGHHVVTKPQTSGVHIILRHSDGTLEGGADPRREGVATGR